MPCSHFARRVKLKEKLFWTPAVREVAVDLNDSWTWFVMCECSPRQNEVGPRAMVSQHMSAADVVASLHCFFASEPLPVSVQGEEHKIGVWLQAGRSFSFSPCLLPALATSNSFWSNIFDQRLKLQLRTVLFQQRCLANTPTKMEKNRWQVVWKERPIVIFLYCGSNINIFKPSQR